MKTEKQEQLKQTEQKIEEEEKKIGWLAKHWAGLLGLESFLLVFDYVAVGTRTVNQSWLFLLIGTFVAGLIYIMACFSLLNDLYEEKEEEQEEAKLEELENRIDKLEEDVYNTEEEQ